MKPSYTPGPWRVGDAGHTVFGPKTEALSPERIANVHGGTSDQSAVTRVFRMKANAQLIAAAPQLVEAAKYVLDQAGLSPNSPSASKLRAALKAAGVEL